MDTLKKTAERNIKLYTGINFLSGILFLAPVIGALKYLVGLSIPQIILISNILTLTVWLFELPTSLIADTIGRKKSLVYSVISNFVASAVIFIFPTYIGFIIASFFGGLYFSFWSGAGQAFLDENLKICGRQKDFGKLIGDFGFAEKFGSLITPILASLILLLTKNFDEIIGYRILAFLDVFVSLFLVIMVFKLIDTTIITENISGIRNILNDNIKTAKKGLKNVFYNSKLRLILIYRSLSNHVAFFYVILLPFLLKQGMPDWYSGIIITISAIGAMLASKFSYKISEKFSYNFSWVFSSVIQGILLIIAGFVLKNWILVILIYIIFDIFEHLWYPAWNHIVVENSQGIAVATTRSIIFGIFALYTTVGKQFLALFPIEYALVGSGIFILGINLIFGKKILELKTI